MTSLVLSSSWKSDHVRPPFWRTVILHVLMVGCAKTERTDALEPKPSTTNADLDPPFLSGGRLRAHVLDDGDGTLAFLEWHDTELNAACAYRRAEDGMVRCLPWVRDGVIPDVTRVVYTDPTCDQAALVLLEGAPVPRNTHDAGTLEPGCGEPLYAVHRVASDRIEAGAVYLRSGAMRECTAIAAGVPEGTVLHPLAEKLAPERFVVAQQRFGPSEGRLRPIELRGDDGSFQRAGIWDAEREEPCFRHPSSIDLCVPDAAWLESWFADADCTIRLVESRDAVTGDTCPLPTLAVLPGEPDTCWRPGALQLFELGSGVESGPTFASDGSSCTPSQDTFSYYRTTRALPADALGEFEVVLVGEGRLRLEGLRGPGGVRLEAADGDARLVDRVGNVTCRPTTACSGAVLCRPTQTAVFTDSECKEAAAEVVAGERCLSDVPRLASAHVPRGACWNGALLDVVEELGQRPSYGVIDGECSLLDEAPRPRFELRRASASSIAPLSLIDRIE